MPIGVEGHLGPHPFIFFHYPSRFSFLDPPVNPSGGLVAIEGLLGHKNVSFRSKVVGTVTPFKDHKYFLNVKVHKMDPEVGLAR